ncbi:MAG: GAP family protein [Planctomycetota bacterium]
MDWPALLALALLDSVNPSAIVVSLILLARPKGGLLVLPYAAGIFATYLVAGVALVSGFELAGAWISQAFDHPVVMLAELLFGLFLLKISWKSPEESPSASSSTPARDTYGGKSLVGLFLLGVAVTGAELPTALPYLAATGFLGTSELTGPAILLRLVVYCLIFIAPPLLLAAGQVLLGKRAGPRYERLRVRLQRAAHETLLWIFALVGFGLAVDGGTRIADRWGLF